MPINTPNMNLPEPIVSVEGGPDWATQLNNCLSIIDTHDHSAGYGVPVTPAGLNISTDLTMNVNNLTLVRSVRFSARSSPLGLVTDLGCLYESGVDLYYNDGSGNQVRLTQSGGVAGSPGSIASLSSPASATYVAATEKFVWQSAANVAASLDARNLILRSSSISSFGLTLQPPTISADFSLTLPSVPVSTKIMSLDNTGVMGANYTVDNSTIEISSNVIQVKNVGITQAKMAVRSTGTTVAAGGFGITSSCGLFTVTSIDPLIPNSVTNLSITITTLGNPVRIAVISDGTSNGARIQVRDSTGSIDTGMSWFIFRGSTNIANGSFAMRVQGASATLDIINQVPISVIDYVDVVAAGTYTYTVRAYRYSASDDVTVEYGKMMAYEIK